MSFIFSSLELFLFLFSSSFPSIYVPLSPLFFHLPFFLSYYPLKFSFSLFLSFFLLSFLLSYLFLLFITFHYQNQRLNLSAYYIPKIHFFLPHKRRFSLRPTNRLTLFCFIIFSPSFILASLSFYLITLSPSTLSLSHTRTRTRAHTPKYTYTYSTFLF